MNEHRNRRRGGFQRQGTPGAEPPAPCLLLLSPKEETLSFTCSASPQRPRKGAHTFIPKAFIQLAGPGTTLSWPGRQLTPLPRRLQARGVEQVG